MPLSLWLPCDVSFVLGAEWISVNYWKIPIYKSMGSSDMDKTPKEKESKTPPATSQVYLGFF